MGCLYKLTSPSGKSYIGITLKTVENRWNNHCRKARRKSTKEKPLYCAIRKYGAKTFIVQTLAVSNDPKYLRELELKAIEIFNTLSPKGYNLKDKGVILEVSKETRKRQSTSAKKRFQNPEERKKAQERSLVMWKKLDVSTYIKQQNKLGKQKLFAKQNMSKANKKRFSNPLERDKIRQATIKYFSNPENRKRASEKAIEQWSRINATAK